MYGAKICAVDGPTQTVDSVDNSLTVIAQNQQVIHRVTHICE